MKQINRQIFMYIVQIVQSVLYLFVYLAANIVTSSAEVSGRSEFYLANKQAVLSTFHTQRATQFLSGKSFPNFVRKFRWTVVTSARAR